MNRQMLTSVAATALIAVVPVSASAQAPEPSPATQGSSLPTAGAVAAVYNQWRMKPLWFQGSIPTPAAAQLLTILRRAPFDGVPAGPALAAQVEASIAQAASGNPEAVKAAEQTLSSAWVMYVQSLKRPTQGMIYAYKMMEPQGTRADQVLLIAAAAPSLEMHLQQVSNLNPIYAQLRAAVFAEAQASGNMTPDPRVLANLDRARSIPAGGKFILVDSATQRLFMYENGTPVDSMKVIVGTDEQPTPMIASVMHYVTVNPYWNAPNNLVRTIAKRAGSEGERYLKSRGYEVMSDWTKNATVVPAAKVDWKAVAAGRQNIRIRQLPGDDNFMGELKFSFPNGQDIFLHDTPRKDLFKEANRALSNGCVRVEDAKRLGRWLMGGRDPVAASPDAEQHVVMPQGVPIVLTYLTAHPKDGKLTYTKDVYGWDRSPAAAIAAANMVNREEPLGSLPRGAMQAQ